MACWTARAPWHLLLAWVSVTACVPRSASQCDRNSDCVPGLVCGADRRCQEECRTDVDCRVASDPSTFTLQCLPGTGGFLRCTQPVSDAGSDAGSDAATDAPDVGVDAPPMNQCGAYAPLGSTGTAPAISQDLVGGRYVMAWMHDTGSNSPLQLVTVDPMDNSVVMRPTMASVPGSPRTPFVHVTAFVGTPMARALILYGSRDQSFLSGLIYNATAGLFTDTPPLFNGFGSPVVRVRAAATAANTLVCGFIQATNTTACQWYDFSTSFNTMFRTASMAASEALVAVAYHEPSSRFRLLTHGAGWQDHVLDVQAVVSSGATAVPFGTGTPNVGLAAARFDATGTGSFWVAVPDQTLGDTIHVRHVTMGGESLTVRLPTGRWHGNVPVGLSISYGTPSLLAVVGMDTNGALWAARQTLPWMGSPTLMAHRLAEAPPAANTFSLCAHAPNVTIASRPTTAFGLGLATATSTQFVRIRDDGTPDCVRP